jgi:hypothetical protein
MAERILGEKGSPRRRRFLWVPMLTIAALALFMVSGAQAVHDLAFQLDGDVIASTTTNVGTLTNPQLLDWDSFFNSSGAPIAGSLTNGFTDSGFSKDFLTKANGTSLNTNDASTFATGSKDTLPIATGWQCNFDHNVNSKIDVMNAYALQYINPANGHQVIYFGLERNTNSGDANVAFWFLQDNVNCDASAGTGSFTGNHRDGDLLIVSAFTNGGTVSTIDVYRWNGGATGSLGTTSVAHGIDCKATAGLDAACATTNGPTNGDAGTITTPWPTANGTSVGHTLAISEFFEGGVDLTAKGLGGECFNVFLGDTRSSQSLTATLFDYARGRLGSCGLTVTTTPSRTTSCVLGACSPTTDTANLSGSSSSGGAGTKPTGTETFFLCGPGVATSGGCPDTLGTQVGTTAVTLGNCNPDVAGHACATSVDASSLITGIGTYCFRAVYDPAGDVNYGSFAGSFTSASECFTVTGNATLSTAQNWEPNDTATVGGDSAFSGNLTFNLYHSADCTGTAVYTEGPTAVSGPASGSTFSTSNTTYKVSLANANTGAWSWGVTYDDATLTDPSASCEPASVSITTGG